ncbi:MAG TPA: response regulator [Thermoanaerobaculia bacterium]|nr:response regulator [Thermoanaerobaculia bacterium]
MDSHKRVLIVDDDSSIRELLQTVLRERGLIVDEAADGEHAIALLAANHYTVVLLDLLMPVTSGLDVLAAIDARGSAPSPVVLVITGAERTMLDSIKSQSVHGIVKKPFDPHEIASVVEACTEVRGRLGLETMALAVMSGAPLLALLGKL